MNRPPCVVGIPIMNLHDFTARVVDDLDELDELVIYDHGSDDPASVEWLAEIELREKVTVDRRAAIPEESLYRSWNDTSRRALATFDGPEVDVVLLNNDVRLPPGFIGFLTRALRSGDPRVLITYPDSKVSLDRGLPNEIQLTPTKGLEAEGGLSGWAFALKAESFRAHVPFIDERLRLCSGDRDLVHNVEIRGNYAARVDGLPAKHAHGETRKKRPELREQQRRDVELWWGELKGQD
ncbi:MAG: glycosyltransferase family 2 protein [Candidatus Limnocylindria bacterium]